MSSSWKLIPLLFLIGCGGGSGDCTADVSGIAAPCARPAHVDARDCDGGDLASFCGGKTSCGSYADTLASLSGSCDGTPSEHSVVRVGTCDSFRFIEVLGSGLGCKLLRFYDASGALVALEVGSDTNSFCDHTSFAQSFGSVPCCTMVTTEVVCASSRVTC
jgi:hypothetical protein